MHGIKKDKFFFENSHFKNAEKPKSAARALSRS